MIQRANTSKYTLKHFNSIDTDAPYGVKNECYNNVLAYAEHLKELGRECVVVLALGAKGLAGANLVTYHYLLQDCETGEYVDFQYDTFTFFPIHYWTLAEYQKERKSFKRKHGDVISGQIFLHYLFHNKELFKYQLYSLRELITDKSFKKSQINGYFKHLEKYMSHRYEPKHGHALITKLEFW